MNSYTGLTATKTLLMNYHRLKYKLLERRHFLFADICKYVSITSRNLKRISEIQHFKTPNIIYKSKIGKTFSLQQQQPLVRLNNRKKVGLSQHQQ